MDIKLKLSRQENLDYYNAEEITIDLEDYLKGVVPSEIGNAALEACKAQAVCCRNYAMNKQASRGYLTDDSNKDQAFRASRLTGYPNAYAAVEATKGEVLYYAGNLALCYYSNSNGGIVNATQRWSTASIPYLKGGQPDEYDNGNGNGHGVGLSQIGAKTEPWQDRLMWKC